ncbi:BTB/POZ protein [Mycena floridula]|nr:BTB/POZ protein [Mycena floridula]
MADDIEMRAADGKEETDWIRVVSNDGFSYLVRRKIANISGTMKNSLDASSGFAEAETKTYVAHDHRGVIVQKLLEYMAFKAHYENGPSKEEVPVKEFMERIPPEIVLELLLAADYQEL